MAQTLITGGAGFIGANLARYLLARGHAVTVLDNFFTGRRSNLEALPVHVVEGDVREPIAGAYEWIFHLACPASPPHYQADPLFTLTTALQGTQRVLEAAERTGATVLIASTSEVYGDPAIHPQDERYWGHVNPLGPRSCYDEGKRAAETMALEYARQRGVDVRLVRIFNTYGPWMDPQDGRVISNFILQALRGEALTLYGDGRQTRSCQFVDDLLRAFERYMAKPREALHAFFSARGMAVPVLNLGNPQEHTIREIAEAVLAAVPEGKRAFIERPLPKDDPKRRRPDITWAKACLDWQPEVPLAEGLARTVACFREAL